jgi:hypothetical protein
MLDIRIMRRSAMSNLSEKLNQKLFDHPGGELYEERNRFLRAVRVLPENEEGIRALCGDDLAFVGRDPQDGKFWAHGKSGCTHWKAFEGGMQMSERKSEYIAGPEPEWSDEEERVAGILHDATCGCDLLMNRPLCLQKRYLLAARSILSTHRLTPIDPEGERLERELMEAIDSWIKDGNQPYLGAGMNACDCLVCTLGKSFYALRAHREAKP